MAFQIPPTTPLPPTGIPPHIQEEVLIAAVIMVISIAAVFLFKPLIAAIARRIEGRGADAALRADVEQLREQVNDLEPLRNRVHELEERIEFTERVLSQRREQDLLPRGDA
jgi:Tfp pilus assembly protein PilO